MLLPWFSVQFANIHELPCGVNLLFRRSVPLQSQRIRDAKILAEALRALVDKEERSAMWRG